MTNLMRCELIGYAQSPTFGLDAGIDSRPCGGASPWASPLGIMGSLLHPHAHRHGYRHHRYARYETHSRTEAASDGSPGRSYTTAELVPSGWQLQPTDPNLKGQRFASPDGEGSLALYATSAEQEPIAKHMNAIVFVEGEQITHLRSEEDWIEVAGFKADHSFYRKAVLACAGRVWGMRSLSSIRRKAKKR